MSAGDRAVWVVYDHPSDYPDDYVVRQWFLRDGQMLATTEGVWVGTLESIRGALDRAGLVCVPRSPQDDPVIVEAWI